MTIKEVYKTILNRVGAKEGDKQVEVLISAGINAAVKKISFIDPISKSATLTVATGALVDLPFDCLSVVMILKDTEMISERFYYNIGSAIMFLDSDYVGEMKLIYNCMPIDINVITDAANTLALKSVYTQAVISYACYYYYVMKNNYNSATMCYNEFNTMTGLQQTKKDDKMNQTMNK